MTAIDIYAHIKSGWPIFAICAVACWFIKDNWRFPDE